MAEYSNLGLYLKQKRKEAKLTQAQVSEKLDGTVHSQFVSNWERGQCAPPNHCLFKLAQILNLDQKDLMKAMLADQRAALESKLNVNSSSSESASRKIGNAG